MYEAADDPYCYRGTTVLKNRLDLRDPIELDKAEKLFAAKRADEPLPPGRLTSIIIASFIATFFKTSIRGRAAFAPSEFQKKAPPFAIRSTSIERCAEFSLSSPTTIGFAICSRETSP